MAADAGALRTAALAHLAALVGFDTRNPPRRIDAGGIFAYLRQHLPGFAFTLADHGAGAVSLLALRGQPKLLFNVHVDTVPDSPAWSADPLALRLSGEGAGELATGLGTCDIKGAAAGLLAAAAHSSGPAAFLFSSDEEGAAPRCIEAFLASRHGFEQVVVAEPTRAQAVLAHRGVGTVRMQFCGSAGHASGAGADQASALHQAVRWGSGALALAAAQARAEFAELTGLRLNIGRIEGGIKPNMVAPSAELRFGLRPLPGQDVAALHRELRALAPASASYEPQFSGPSLPASVADAGPQRARAAGLAESLRLPIGAAVDFWTEAALFSAAGCTAIVYGPGDIAQAHTADEWVAVPELVAYTQSVTRLLQGAPP